MSDVNTVSNELISKIDKIKGQLEVTLQGTLTPESFELIMKVISEQTADQIFESLKADYKQRL
jgi:hypothetical protein